jgi:hypothetical protein
MPTTSQILGLTPQEVNAAAFTASGEAGGGNDLGGVLQTILARRAANPKLNIVGLVTAPQQFVANDRYNPQQVSDPNFGRKVYGSRYNQAVNTLENPNLMSGFLQAGQGATSFRGQALLKNKRPDDIMFDKSGNFYFDRNPQIANSLIQRLGKPAPIGLASGEATTTPATTASTNQQTGNIYNYYFGDGSTDTAKNFLTSFLPRIQGITSKFDPISALQQAMFSTPNYFGDEDKE